MSSVKLGGQEKDFKKKPSHRKVTEAAEFHRREFGFLLVFADNSITVFSNMLFSVSLGVFGQTRWAREGF
ncbi:MAG: hypothetical protein ACT6FF_05320 [Methanosarcinaceae archaeon]